MLKKNTAALSLPKSKTVRGYEIKRLALGGYIRAFELLQEFPTDLMEACFPGDGLRGILERLKRFDAALLESIMGGALAAAPALIIKITAELTGIDEQELRDNPDVGPVGLVEILTVWAEVNSIADFMPAVRKLIGKMRAAVGSSQKPSTGSNA